MHATTTRHARVGNAAATAAWAAGYEEVMVDLGTGDGRFVYDQARRCPGWAVIGVDTCLGNLRRSARSTPDNARFVVADGLALPRELHRLATAATINFPWGSLLAGLLDGDEGLLTGLRAVGRDGMSLAVRLNAGALAAAGWELEAAGERVVTTLRHAGLSVGPIRAMGSRTLRDLPTTWAKRLAFGRDPRAIEMTAVLAERGDAGHRDCAIPASLGRRGRSSGGIVAGRREREGRLDAGR
ncbi:MAG: class I SAM-dependent methyltransferase [Chloroflexota bacterium]|nr:class I SAM-dependent methyltransferase [Chloroflexota bacterium]